MKHLITAGLLSLLSAGTVAAGPATAPSPLGEWRVKDGTADIRIVNCNGGLWGVISWVQGDPGKDTNNPDPSLRERSMMGVPILINMHQSGNLWEGNVYNAQDGETYTAHINLVSPDVLSIEGCGMFGLDLRRRELDARPFSQGQPQRSDCVLPAPQISRFSGFAILRGCLRARRPHQERLEQHSGSHRAHQRES